MHLRPSRVVTNALRVPGTDRDIAPQLIMYNKPMRTFRRETAFFLLALLIGLAVRLIGLGARPLTDQEATWALQALNVASGTHPAVGSNSVYVALTATLFFAFGGASNALARLIPALAGSALILIPMLFRERLKPRAT